MNTSRKDHTHPITQLFARTKESLLRSISQTAATLKRACGLSERHGPAHKHGLVEPIFSQGPIDTLFLVPVRAYDLDPYSILVCDLENINSRHAK